MSRIEEIAKELIINEVSKNLDITDILSFKKCSKNLNSTLSQFINLRKSAINENLLLFNSSNFNLIAAQHLLFEGIQNKDNSMVVKALVINALVDQKSLSYIRTERHITRNERTKKIFKLIILIYDKYYNLGYKLPEYLKDVTLFNNEELLFSIIIMVA